MIVDEKEQIVEKKKEASIKLCCVVCVSLNRKKVKVAKILRVVIEFRFKKRRLDVVLNLIDWRKNELLTAVCLI
jgi:hypothetical protein